jgi:hypothetical protein
MQLYHSMVYDRAPYGPSLYAVKSLRFRQTWPDKKVNAVPRIRATAKEIPILRRITALKPIAANI